MNQKNSEISFKLKDIVISERENVCLWYIVSFMGGILIYFYFALSFWLVCVCFFVALVAIRYRTQSFYILYLMLILGIGVSYFRYQYLDTNMLEKPLYRQSIRAEIKEVRNKPNGSVVLITKNNRLKSGVKINNLRIVAYQQKKVFLAGDKICLFGHIFPSKKSNKTHFDFQRYDYFKAISGTIFTKKKIRLLERKEKSSLQVGIDNFRQKISDNLISHLGVKIGSLSSALIVGDKSMIPKKENEYIRNSGVSHIFAVSGLHLTLISAIIFFMVRYILSFSVSISQRYNTKKLAALVAILITLLYLLITGVQVSALRAFVMISLYMIAIILDYQPDLKRAIGGTAFLMLLFFPEFIFQPGFQLSFIATLALISTFETLSHDNLKINTRNIILKYCLGVVLSSFVATIATSMFVLYHFQFLSNYAIFANLIVSPIIGFIVMPAVVAYYFFMPISFENIALYPIKWGLDFLIKVSEKISHLEYSILSLKNYGDLNLIIFAAGIFWLCLWSRAHRYFGLLIMFLAFIL